MKLKVLCCLIIAMFFGVLGFSSQLFAQGTSIFPFLQSKESMPNFLVLKTQKDELPKLVDDYSDQMKTCQKLYADLKTSLNVSAQKEVLLRQSNLLEKCNISALAKLFRFGVIATDLHRVRNNLLASAQSGWTTDQLTKVDHWYESMLVKYGKLGRIQIRYVSHEEIDFLLSKAIALVNARLVYFTHQSFLFA